MSFTLRTSCKDDIEPNSGLGERGSDGGCSRGRCGAARFAPMKTIQTIIRLLYRFRFQ